MMRIRIDASLDYFFAQPTDVLLAVEALRLDDQHVVSDRLDVNGSCELWPVDGAGPDSLRKWMQASGEVRVSYQATVDVTRGLVDMAGLYVPSRRDLPEDVIPFLFPSRYCESDRFETFAMKRFAGVFGGDQVLMMADWINRNFDYVPGASNGHTTAADTFMTRQGVCRDYAHVLISFARAVGIPARMVSVYAPDIQPPDFHAVVEVWLDGAWYLIDPTRLSREDNLVRIATGRDATDISFMTIFGAADLRNQSVAVTMMEPVG